MSSLTNSNLIWGQILVLLSHVPVCSSALQAEAEVVHPVQVLSREGVVPQLPEVLGPQILPSVPRHGVITLGEWTEDQR